MTKHVQCPHCGQAYALTEEQVTRFAGQDITCTQCGESFLVSHDLAMTGGLATAPPPYVPPPFAPRMAYGYGGAAVAASTPSVVPPNEAFDAPPYRYNPSNYASRAALQTSGWATASIVFAVIGLFVP